jgi:hypothetical protein
MDREIEKSAKQSLAVVSLGTASLIVCFSVALAVL